MKSKKWFFICIIITTCVLCCACSKLTVPNLLNVDETTAKTLLTSNSIIPGVKYEYCNDVAAGCVIRTEPEIGASIDKNSLVTLVVSNGPALTVPNILGVDEMTAKNVLSSNSLIPETIYDYSDNAARGDVFKTYPVVGAQVDKNERIKIYVSKGPSYVKAADAVISWRNVTTYAKDDWNFYAPYIDKDILYIGCEVAFGASLEWNDSNKSGGIIGTAIIKDTNLTVPVSAKYSKQSTAANETQAFIIEIPISKLDGLKPTSIDLELSAMVDGNNTNVTCSFTISW